MRKNMLFYKCLNIKYLNQNHWYFCFSQELRFSQFLLCFVSEYLMGKHWKWKWEKCFSVDRKRASIFLNKLDPICCFMRAMAAGPHNFDPCIPAPFLIISRSSTNDTSLATIQSFTLLFFLPIFSLLLFVINTEIMAGQKVWFDGLDFASIRTYTYNKRYYTWPRPPTSSERYQLILVVS